MKVLSIQMFGDISGNTTVVCYSMFYRNVLHWMNDIAHSVFFTMILHLVGVFYQYRYVKEQLTVILATLFDL